MDGYLLNEIIRRYENVSFSVQKKAETLIKEEISEDLTSDQHFVLRYIHSKEECTSTELADVFHVKKSSVTAIINRLVNRGLIERRRDTDDRRIVYLSLSESGEELFELSQEKVHKLVASFIQKFDEEEIMQFMSTYEKLDGYLDDLIKGKEEEK